MTFQGQGHVISRLLLLILVAYVRMHLFAKFDVIQMTPNVTDRQSNIQTNRYTPVITTEDCDGAGSDNTEG